MSKRKNRKSEAATEVEGVQTEAQAEPAPIVAHDPDDLDALLSAEEPVNSNEGDLFDAGADGQIDKDEVYAQQTSSLVVADPTAEVVSSKAKTRAKKDKVAEAAAPRRMIDMAKLTDMVGEAEANRLSSQITTLPKKVQDKAMNALSALTSGSKMSTYTEATIKLLKEKGAVTSAELKAAMTAAGYQSRTVASQSQQQMVVLTYLGIVNRDKAARTLTLNTENPLTQRAVAA